MCCCRRTSSWSSFWIRVCSLWAPLILSAPVPALLSQHHATSRLPLYGTQPHQYQQKPRTVIKLICHWCVSLLQGCVRFGRAAGRPAGPTLFVPWPRAGSVVVCRPGVFYVCLSRCVSMAQGGSSAPRPVSGRPAGGFGEQQPSADQSLSQISASHAGNRGHLTRIHTVSFTTHTHRPFHFMFVHVCRVFRICFVCENVKLILCVVL